MGQKVAIDAQLIPPPKNNLFVIHQWRAPQAVANRYQG